jgi:hypothetical protein
MTIGRLAAAALIATVTGTVCSTALAKDPAPVSGASAVSQYVEVMPSAGGPVVSGTQQSPVRKSSPVRATTTAAESTPTHANGNARKIGQPVSAARSLRMSGSVFAVPVHVALDRSTRSHVIGLAAVLLLTPVSVLGLSRKRRRPAPHDDSDIASS